MPPIEYHELDNNIWVVIPAGRLDATLASALDDLLQTLIQQERIRLIVAFESVTYLASSGLKALIAARRKAQAAGGDIVLAGLSPRVREVLEITGLVRLFRIYPSPKDAVNAFPNGEQGGGNG